MNRRRALVLLTVLWLPSLVLSALLLSGRWLSGSDDALPRSVLLVLVGVETVLVLTGWAIVAWQAMAPQTVEDVPAPSEPPVDEAPPARPEEQPVTLAQLQALSPGEFEAWVQNFFRDRGYFAYNTPDARDHGIDLLLVTPSGQPGIVQCKRYEGTVGEPVVRDLYGVMEHENAQLGFLVTTGRISEEAERWATDKPIELIDGRELVELANSSRQFPGQADA